MSLPPLLAQVPWRPFLDPMPVEWFDHWMWYLVPMAILVSGVYKAVRMYDWSPGRYARAVAVMTIQIILGMIALAAASYLLVEVFVPWMRQ